MHNRSGDLDLSNSLSDEFTRWSSAMAPRSAAGHTRVLPISALNKKACMLREERRAAAHLESRLGLVGFDIWAVTTHRWASTTAAAIKHGSCPIVIISS